MSRHDDRLENLNEARRLFHKDDEGKLVLQGEFVDYSVDSSLGVQTGQATACGAAVIAQNLQYITWDLVNLGLILQRMEWLTSLASDGHLDEGKWRRFLSLDIEHFFIEIRSILDYAAPCISAAADQLGCVPPNSFNDIRNWLDKNPGNYKRLGADLVSLVESASFFPELKQVRDTIVHRGGLTLVFGKPQDGIRFQVHKGFNPLVITRSDAHNSNVVDFRLYGSLLLENLLVFVEQLAQALAHRVPVQHYGVGSARLLVGGWEVVLEWFDRWPKSGLP